MTDDLPQHCSFFTFKTKQNVSKSKLGGEFAKKGWNDFSNGFSEKIQETSFTKGEEPIKKKPKINSEEFKKRIFTGGCKTKQRKPIIEHREADFFTSKAEDFCSLIQKKSLETENQKDPKISSLNNCSNSVFLEVLNIRKKNPQINLEEFKKLIFNEGCKTKPRNPIIEHKEADFFTSKAKDFCSLIQKKSLQAENQKDVKTCNINNSVFLEVQNIQDSFQQCRSTLQPKFGFKSPNCNFTSDLATKKVGGQENIPSKSGCQFSFHENDFSQSLSVKKVQKTNVFSSLAKKNLTVVNNLSEPITNSSYLKNNTFGIKNSDCEKFPANTKKVLWLDQNQNKNANFNLSAFLEAESSANKGSSWLQSLHISDTEVAQEDNIGKKRIKNVLPGGFSEQMLKLQRIEKSEEVIWDHNVDKNKKKGKHLTLVLTSVSCSGGIVIAKCLSLPTEGSKGGMEGDVKESDGVSTESKRVVVLLKKSIFNKLHLKAQSILHLYPPWQTLHLPLTSCPVLLCAKFIDLNSSKEEVTQDNILYNHPISSSSSTSACHQASNCFNAIFHQWNEPISLSGRVQRIWKVETTLNKNVFPYTSTLNHFRYSLLIQEQNGIFYELMLPPTHLLPHFWEEFISEAEGKCCQFHELHLVRKFCFNKHPQLFRVLDLLSTPQDDGNSVKQEFCYQLAFHGCSAIPEVVSDEGFPAYCPLSLQPLACLFTEMNIQRVTCVGKIMFQFRKTLYLCDDSVTKYVRLESLFPLRSERPLVGSSVLIRDAQWLQGCLFLDNYSSFVQLSEYFEMDERLGNGLDQLANVALQNVIPLVDVTSENSMFVFIEGEIIGVDANNALSWLQCNLCLSDNLVQDTQLVIHCEDCFQVVPKPVLNVKMSVTCQCSPLVKVEVELLSKTIKRLLQINDNTHQPRCNIEDVLGKQMGPLLCWIRSSATVGDSKQFCASEVEAS